jgi:hypothetical protein
MNAKVLSSLERSYIQLDWKEYISKIEMNAEQMIKIIDLIEVFKKIKGTKELVVFRFEGVPAYVTVKKEEYSSILDWIHQRMLDFEIFEQCKRIDDIIKSL